MKQLSKMVNVSESYISLLESGGRQPSRDVVLKIAQALYPNGNDALLDELLISAGFTPTNLDNFNKRQNDLVTIYEQSLEQNENDFKVYVSLVLLLIREGRYKQAKERIEKGLLVFDDSIKLQTLLANLELAKGNYDEAAIAQKAAIEQSRLKVSRTNQTDIHLSDLLLNLGIIQFMQGKASDNKLKYYLEAKQTFQEALTLVPDDIYLLDEFARVNFNLAEISGQDEQAAMNYWQETIDSFKKVVFAHNNQSLGYDNLLESCAFLAHAYTKNRQFEDAEYSLNLMIATTPRYWFTHYVKACFYSLKYEKTSQAQLLDQSIKSLSMAISLKPEVKRFAQHEPDLTNTIKNKQEEFKELISDVT